MELPKNYSKKCGICLRQSQNGKKNNICSCWESDSIALKVQDKLKTYNCKNIKEYNKMWSEADTHIRTT